MRRQTKRDLQKTPIFAPTAGACSSISPKLCMLIENVVTILKGANHFLIQCIVFPAGAKMHGNLPVKTYHHHHHHNSICSARFTKFANGALQLYAPHSCGILFSFVGHLFFSHLSKL